MQEIKLFFCVSDVAFLRNPVTLRSLHQAFSALNEAICGVGDVCQAQ